MMQQLFKAQTFASVEKILAITIIYFRFPKLKENIGRQSLAQYALMKVAECYRNCSMQSV